MQRSYYVVRSRKSEETVDDLHQISMGCDNHPDTYGFLWVDAQNRPHYMQFIFDEVMLEWFPEHGVRLGQTNRNLPESDQGVGRFKGSRTIEDHTDDALLQHLLKRMCNSEFPAEWEEPIRSRFLG
ncbi:MAG: hypothetical protein CL923_10495 [Deltaproteobacteria bacterium]|jgi:hypothetical protein|nr:hypothetical protein [Deltaproteobacteria bacterium]MDP7317900.1 hypothetical protein [SAR324 cluster bacterium]MDP7630665.1 hypothetical protein [SAR324 cluster bacterium]|tara:strand:+ start:276 stop:653 length:378 start_codon:yes stop_codon:yes gene_type:complete